MLGHPAANPFGGQVLMHSLRPRVFASRNFESEGIGLRSEEGQSEDAISTNFLGFSGLGEGASRARRRLVVSAAFCTATRTTNGSKRAWTIRAAN